MGNCRQVNPYLAALLPWPNLLKNLIPSRYSNFIVYNSLVPAFSIMPLPTVLFNYPLPASAIAQHPADRRDHSRLMVIHRATREVEHRYFYELPEIPRSARGSSLRIARIRITRTR